MSDGRIARSDERHRIQPIKWRIAQLEAELRAVRQQAKAQRQRIADKCGLEFLVLIDHPNTKVTVRNIVQSLVFEDEEGNTISKTEGALVGKLIEVRFKSLH